MSQFQFYIQSKKEHFSSYDHEFWPVAWTVKFDVNMVKMNNLARCLDHGSFLPKLLSGRAHSQKDAHNRWIDLS